MKIYKINFYLKQQANF